MLFAGLAFFRQEVAPQFERHSHHRVKTGSSDLAIDLFGMLARRQVEGCASPRIQVLENRVLCFPVEKVTRGNHVPALAWFRPHHHQLVGVRIRHGREQGGVDNAVNCGACANPQRQCDDRHGGEPRTLPQKPSRIPKILGQSSQHDSVSHSYRSATMGSTFVARRAGM